MSQHDSTDSPCRNGAGPTVYVVDGDQAVREGLRALLDSMNVSVEVFVSAEELLQSGISKSRGCVITDVALPGMNGLELQRRLRAEGAEVPVIFVASASDVPMAVNAMRDGAFDFFEKPFVDRLLLQRILGALELQ